MAKITITPLPKDDPIFQKPFMTNGKKPIQNQPKVKEVKKCPSKK